MVLQVLRIGTVLTVAVVGMEFDLESGDLIATEDDTTMDQVED